MASILVLGRQPAISLAEIESLYGQEKISLIGEHVALVDVDPCLLAYDRLGGSLKFCKLLTTLETTDWNKITRYLIDVAPEHSKSMPEGKMFLGISAIDFKLENKDLHSLGLSLKKAISKKTERSVRFIPNKTLELNAAQIIHNHLTGTNGWELVLIKDGNKTQITQTIRVQNILAYAKRDQARPKRDARVGMLPPKLAQIIINLAVGTLPESARQSVCEIPPDQPIPKPDYKDFKILDPFCGTGVIIQEALLMGYEVQASDIDPRMISYTKENLNWLRDYDSSLSEQTIAKISVEEADATTHQWKEPISSVASEIYLGRAYSTQPTQEELERNLSACNLITRNFLKNLWQQLKPGTRMCLAVPAWKDASGKIRHLPVVDQLTDLGYNLVSFEHAQWDELVYYRSDQIVARELLVIIRN